MDILRKRWCIAPVNYPLQMQISEELNISPALAQICINRGLSSAQRVKEFLSISPENFHDPFCFRDMPKAVKTIEEQLHQGGKILIYGDYDVDGITSTALLFLFLKSRNAQVEYYIPNRNEEGYGLHEEVIYQAGEKGTGLIITVDCGISSAKEVQLARSLGIKTVITDHHQPPRELPEAEAIINPKINDSGYPFSDLAGVGVVWKLAQALDHNLGKKKTCLWEYLDLVCLGTIGDVVPLTGENRIIVGLGLDFLPQGRAGIRALMEVAGFKEKTVTTGQVSFGLAPRLNAAGRISDAGQGVELLTCEDYQSCREIAEELNKQNVLRQAWEKEILQQATDKIEKEINLQEDYVLVLWGEDWHVGIIGIVASRLVEKYYRPVILLSLEGELVKGSARSIAGFNIFLALEQCKDLLIQFGGHKQAAGLKMAAANLSAFRRRINAIAHRILTQEQLIPQVKIDLEIEVNGSEGDLALEVEKLAPFGLGNPCPVFASRGLKVADAKLVGGNSAHLKLRFEAHQCYVDAIGFNKAPDFEWLVLGNKVDAAFTLEINKYNGREKTQFVLKDIQPHPVFALAGSMQKGKEPDNFSRSNKEIDGPMRDALTRGERIAASMPLDRARAVWHAAALNHHRNGEQTLVLCPYSSLLQTEYRLAESSLSTAGITVGMGHSFMAGEEQEKIRQAFFSGIITVLVATPEFMDGWKSSSPCFEVIVSDPFCFVGEEDAYLWACAQVCDQYTGKGLFAYIPLNMENYVHSMAKIFSCSRTYSDDSRKAFVFSDFRAKENRFNYLSRLLKTGERCLIYHNSYRQAEILVRQIQGVTGFSGRVALCHDLQPSWKHKLIREQVRWERIQAVVAAGQIGVKTGDFDHVVFFQPPENLFGLGTLSGWWETGKQPQVHLIYNNDDLKMMKRILHYRYPTREILGKLYRTAKKMVSTGISLTGNNAKAGQRLFAAGKNFLEESPVDAFLSIMIELGLIREICRGKRRELELVEVNQKLNLANSRCYREGTREAQAAQFWYTVAMAEDLAERLETIWR